MESKSGRCNYHELGFLDRACLAGSPVMRYLRFLKFRALTCCRFNPIFVRPIPNNPEFPATGDASDTNQAPSGRRRPVVQHTAANTPRSRIPITGFQELSLLSVISMTGHVPRSNGGRTISSLNDIRKRANRPIVVLPECTTSNGRGLLRFSPVFRRNIPVKEYQVFVMCVRSVSRACKATFK